VTPPVLAPTTLGYVIELPLPPATAPPIPDEKDVEALSGRRKEPLKEITTSPPTWAMSTTTPASAVPHNPSTPDKSTAQLKSLNDPFR
jgi:hypothetical protein